MKNIGLKIAIVAGLAAFSLASIPNAASAASHRSEMAAKRAVCKERASRMGFGMHWIKRNRWVKACVAGKHPV
jgi:hypothetical protein